MVRAMTEFVNGSIIADTPDFVIELRKERENSDKLKSRIAKLEARLDIADETIKLLKKRIDDLL